MKEVKIYRKETQAFQCPYCKKISRLKMPKRRKEKKSFFERLGDIEL